MSSANESSAVGVFDNLEKAERTIDELRQAGIPADDIGIIGHVGDDQQVPTPPETHAPEENAIAGFTRGAIIGALVGTLVALVVPGISAVANLGRWFEIVGGAAIGALGCSVLVAFSTFAFMQRRTRLYAAELEKGHFIVTVRNSARKSEAVSVLRHRGQSVE